MAILSAAFLPSCGHKASGPVPVCHLLVCCRGYNSGSTFLVQDKWNPAHDYRDIAQVRDILQKIKDAGINVVSIDFTNPSQWEAWDEYGKMLDNIVTVCHEKEMEFLMFIGNPAAWTMKYWNGIAGKIWDKYAQDPSYRRYGFGDDTCDAIHWGISDASASERPVHINPSTVNDPFIYYNIVKKALK